MEPTPLGLRTTLTVDKLENAARHLVNDAEIAAVYGPDVVELSPEAVVLTLSRPSISATVAVVDNQTGIAKIFNDVLD